MPSYPPSSQFLHRPTFQPQWSAQDAQMDQAAHFNSFPCPARYARNASYASPLHLSPRTSSLFNTALISPIVTGCLHDPQGSMNAYVITCYSLWLVRNCLCLLDCAVFEGRCLYLSPICVSKASHHRFSYGLLREWAVMHTYVYIRCH